MIWILIFVYMTSINVNQIYLLKVVFKMNSKSVIRAANALLQAILNMPPLGNTGGKKNKNFYPLSKLGNESNVF